MFKVGDRVDKIDGGLDVGTTGTVVKLYPANPDVVDYQPDASDALSGTPYTTAVRNLVASASPTGFSSIGNLTEAGIAALGQQLVEAFDGTQVLRTQGAERELTCDCGGKKTFGIVSKETCAPYCSTQGKA